MDLLRMDLLRMDLLRMDLLRMDLLRMDFLRMDLLRMDLLRMDLLRIDLLRITLVSNWTCSESLCLYFEIWFCVQQRESKRALRRPAGIALSLLNLMFNAKTDFPLLFFHQLPGN
jgi:hypothetical protein